MWVIDCPLKQGKTEKCSYIISKIGKSYVFGSSKGSLKDLDIPVVTDLALSRRQLEFKISPNGSDLMAINTGARTFNLKLKEGKEIKLPYKSKDWITLTDDCCMYKDYTGNSMKIELEFKHLKVKSVSVSSYCSKKFGKLMKNFEFRVDNRLSDNEIEMDGIVYKVTDIEKWTKRLLKGDWKTEGGIDHYIIPSVEPVHEVVEIPDSEEDESGHELIILPPPQHQQVTDLNRKADDITTPGDAAGDNDFIIVPPPSHTQSRIQKKGDVAKSETQSILTLLMQDEEELKTQPRKRKSKKKSNDLTQAPSQEDTATQKDFQIEIKKEVEPEAEGKLIINNDETKGLETEIENSKIAKRPIEDSVPVGAKRMKTNNNLVGTLLKARELKIEKNKKEEKLIQAGSKSDVKVTKFKVISVKNDFLPKISSLSIQDKPEWKDRVNYSKFKKVNKYNPVLDSTIQYIKMRSSKYRSTDTQMDSNRHEYLLEENEILAFDNEFEDTQNRGAYKLKRRNQHDSPVAQTGLKKPHKVTSSLFVPSDDENEDYEEHATYSKTHPSTTSHRIDHPKLVSSTKSMLSKELQSDSDDDDVPVLSF